MVLTHRHAKWIILIKKPSVYYRNRDDNVKFIKGYLHVVEVITHIK